MAIAKIAAGIVAVGGVATAATIAMLSSGAGMPAWKALSEDGNYKEEIKASKPYKDKYAETYGRFLVGVDGNSNDAWWNWAFKNRYEADQSKSDKGKFVGLTSGTGAQKSLKSACLEAYKQSNGDNGKIKKAGTISNDDEFRDKDIWKYCSPLETRPVVVNDVASEKSVYGDSNIGSNTANVSKLASITDDKNALFWEIMSKDFWSDEGKPTTTHKYFEDFYNKKKTTKPSLKDRCKEAYGKPNGTSSSEAEKPISSEVLKFCSFDGK